MTSQRFKEEKLQGIKYCFKQIYRKRQKYVKIQSCKLRMGIMLLNSRGVQTEPPSAIALLGIPRMPTQLWKYYAGLTIGLHTCEGVAGSQMV